MAAALPTGGASVTGGAPYKGNPHQLPNPTKPTGGAPPTTAPPTAGGKGAPHAPKPNHGTAGHWIQQGGQWQLIHAVGPGQWAKGPKEGFNAPPKPKAMAHAAGQRAGQQNFNPLEPMTMQQIRSQALSEVRGAYKPAYSELNLEGSQEQAIYAKQQSDNQYYQQWLDSKMQSVQASQDAVDQSTTALESQILGATTSAMGAQNTALAQAPGSATESFLQSSESAANIRAAAQAQHGVTAEQVAQAGLGSAEMNASNFLQAGAQKESAAFQDAMNKIAVTRSGLVAKEGGDIEKEIARLQGVAISVAENNRNYQAAAEKLGLTKAQIGSEIAARAAGTKLAQGRLDVAKVNANTALLRLEHTVKQDDFNNWIKKQNLNIHQQQLVNTLLNGQSERALHAAEIYKAQHGGGLTPSEQNTIYGTIDRATGLINSLIATGRGQPGLTPGEAYQALLRGGYEGRKLNQLGKVVPGWIVIPRMSNQSLLNAAFNLANTHTGGLTQGDVAYLERLGLVNPLGRYHQVNARSDGGDTAANWRT